MSVPTRTVRCEDALAFLERSPVFEGCSFVTSLPDVSELALPSLDAWSAWFRRAASLVLSRTPDAGVAVFFQSDIKKAGAWVDKGFLVSLAAHELGVPLLFHKLVLRRPPGTVTFGRAAYSHLLAFSRGLKLDLGKPFPDVLASPGPMLWPRAMGLAACATAIRFIQSHSPQTHTIVDPFCGTGSALATANLLGLNALGVELHRKRAAKARALSLPPDALSQLESPSHGDPWRGALGGAPEFADG